MLVSSPTFLDDGASTHIFYEETMKKYESDEISPRIDSETRRTYEKQYSLLPGLLPDSYIRGLQRYDDIVGNKIKVRMKNGTVYYRDRVKGQRTKETPKKQRKRKRAKKRQEDRQQELSVGQKVLATAAGLGIGGLAAKKIAERKTKREEERKKKKGINVVAILRSLLVLLVSG